MLAPAFLCGYSGPVFRVLEVFTRISTETGNFSTSSADLSTKPDVSCIAERRAGWSTSIIDSDRSGPPGPGVAGEDGSEERVRKDRFGRVSPERPVRKDGFSQGKVRECRPERALVCGLAEPARPNRPQGRGPGSRDYSRPFRGFAGSGCKSGVRRRRRSHRPSPRQHGRPPPSPFRTGDGRLVRLDVFLLKNRILAPVSRHIP